ncbi:MAG TPA: UDP-N-acetylmuramoyl-L-alanine--D-glutamate ligase [Candidatus Limiplasma sp.]|nr:UDP-N-acetylmuramoyl-L-alanine--D-glutamate ligase [Candidatus Limiplasma sp.]HPR77707.1 UDP-N-acetylmuramoyl-L-alanine--D-glutamate ligase [Candidatus Limiplasma sp.]
MKVEKKRVLLVGMARSGIAAAELLLNHGAIPILYDAKKAESFGDELASLRGTACEFHLGEDPFLLMENADLVVISPGVPIDAPIAKAARENGIPLIGELELGYALSQGELLAVSGTNGKTTTVTLLGKMFENAGRVTYVAGNIGYPLSAAALNSKKGDVIVAEVSSFQLESIKTFHPCVAALLNITEDHLNRHGTMEQYIRMKQRIFENQTEDDIAVLNMDDPVLFKMAEKIKARVAFFSRTREVENGACVENGKIIWRWDGIVKPICDADQILIPGPHNLENALAATAMASARGVPPAVIRHTLQSFTGVEHRIEKVRVLEGITYINDSKGTNVDSTIKAVQSMKAPTVLILGGYDKHTDFMPLCREMLASGMIRHTVVMGETARQITQTLEEAGYQSVTQAFSLEDAVQKARSFAVSGGNVLLSPACASFDMFQDYEERGRIFKQIVNAL